MRASSVNLPRQPPDPVRSLSFLRWAATCHFDSSSSNPAEPPVTEGEWSHVAEEAEAHSVGGLVYWNLSRLPTDASVKQACPPDVWERLRESYYRNVARNLSLREELGRLAGIFQANGIRPIVLRGLTFVGSLYPDDGLRSSDDCDLVVRPVERDKVHDLLLREGYGLHESGVHVYSKRHMHIDLHTGFGDEDRLRTSARLHRIAAALVWAEARPFSTSGGDLLQLSQRDSLLINALHLLKHDYERLIWKLDLVHLTLRLKASGAWPGVIERAEAFGLTVPLACPVAYGEDLLPGVLQGTLETVRHNLPTGVAKRLFRFLQQDRELGGLSFLILAWMSPRLRDRARFLGEAILPGPGIRAGMRAEWRERGVPKTLLIDRCQKLRRAFQFLIAVLRTR